MRRGQGSEGLAQAQCRNMGLASMGKLVLQFGPGSSLSWRHAPDLKLGPGYVFKLKPLYLNQGRVCA